VATLVGAAPAASGRIGPFVYGTDGSGANHLIVPAGGLRRERVPDAPAVEDESGNARTANDLYMNGAEVFNFTLRVVPDVVVRLLARGGVTMEDVDLFVFHQAN
jgi:3-oxoacyl-[acyl-carrier-protein] synthase-3